MKTTGISRVASFSFSRRQVSNPSIPGIITSSRIRSGCTCFNRSKAFSPSVATLTS